MAAIDGIEYERSIEGGETRETRESYWKAAKGLQAVDGLETSQYLDTVAEGHIEGRYSSSRAVDLVKEYYDRKTARSEKAASKEADLVSSRIVQLLSDVAFTFKPSMLAYIHGALFEGLLPRAYIGTFRDYNISKKEPVLAYRSVDYAPWQTIRDNLAYDFGEVQASPLVRDGTVDAVRLERFVANVWQTHPFVEGNTRTVAVFAELLLRHIGADVDNSQFEKHSLYFRNALVRASYSSIRDGVTEDRTGLDRFFANLLFDGNYELRNRDLYSQELYDAEGLENPFGRQRS